MTVDGKDHSSVKRSGAPFNRPTNVAVGADGDVFCGWLWNRVCTPLYAVGESRHVLGGPALVLVSSSFPTQL